jgi:hypothetical protein
MRKEAMKKRIGSFGIFTLALTLAAAGCATMGGGGSAVDKVFIGNQVSENAHQMEALDTENGVNIENRRHAIDGGYFQFTLKTGGNTNLALEVRYWAHEVGERSFTISVDDTEIATENVVGKFNREEVKKEFYDVQYPIPAGLVQGKDAITVKFQGVDEYQTAGGVYGLSLVKVGE